MNLFPFVPGYTQFIYNDSREPAFVMLLGFLIAFMIARGYTRAARIWGWGSVSLNGTHTHHLVFGIVIALVAGALQISFNPDPGLAQLSLAAAFGVGAALILDEFALIFYLQDVYWEQEGRKSVDAVIIAIALGTLFLLHVTPFGSSAPDTPRTILLVAQILNMIFVVIAALKGKLFLATFGVFIPFLAQVGSIRLAEPGSIWDRRLYSKNKRQRSTKRYAKYEKTWRPRKERLMDIIGGKIGRPNHSKPS